MPVRPASVHAARTFRLSDTKSKAAMRGGLGLVSFGCSGVAEVSVSNDAVDRCKSALSASATTPTPRCLLLAGARVRKRASALPSCHGSTVPHYAPPPRGRSTTSDARTRARAHKPAPGRGVYLPDRRHSACTRAQPAPPATTAQACAHLLSLSPRARSACEHADIMARAGEPVGRLPRALPGSPRLRTPGKSQALPGCDTHTVPLRSNH